MLLACGAAAGMSATFNTPIAGVILAIELLLFEFKSRSFIPLVIASTLATAMHMQLLGAGPMFSVAAMDFGIPHALRLLSHYWEWSAGSPRSASASCLYWAEDQFEKLPIDELWWPAIGALGLGIIGYFVPRVLGCRIRHHRRHPEWKPGSEAAAGRHDREGRGAGDLAGLRHLGRIACPHVHVERSHGWRVRHGDESHFPVGPPSAGAFALVAMGAVFGAASRATFSFIIFAFEITRDYNSVFR